MFLSTRLRFVPSLCVFLAGFAVAGAQAEDAPKQHNIKLELGGGAKVEPAYEGASRYEVKPSVVVRVKALRFKAINFGYGDDLGFSIGPSFGIQSERTAQDDPILSGIPNVDRSFELGLALSYEWEHARVFTNARFGVTGHNGFVGEVGGDAIWRPDQATTISIGPRLSFADDQYMSTYFSVPTTALNLPAYNASSGFKSVGIEAALRYDFSDAWAGEVATGWSRLIGDAADSPIVAAGSVDQFNGKLSLIRKFDLDF
ncbi:MAG: MipA/OmpV family protein [Alphaproteobacteria bacterium]|nr:MipA/OmpV family protein [Alphaproteobacteria bacterium]